MKTISLELAKELQQICKEKNITMPESELVWMPYKDIVVGRKGTHRHYFNPAFISENYRDLIKDDWHKAYTLDELLEWLPKKIKVDYRFHLTTTSFNQYMVYYDKHTNTIEQDPNPTNACAKLLIWLLKEGLI